MYNSPYVSEYIILTLYLSSLFLEKLLWKNFILIGVIVLKRTKNGTYQEVQILAHCSQENVLPFGDLEVLPRLKVMLVFRGVITSSSICDPLF